MNTQDPASRSKTSTLGAWPSWLDGRTLAILAALLTLGTMMQTAHSRLSADIAKVRDDLSADIAKLRDDLSADIAKLRDDNTKLRDDLSADIEKLRDDVSGDIAKVRDDLSGDIEKVRADLSADLGTINDRLRAVEIDVAAIRTAVIGLGTRTGAAKRSRHLDAAENIER